MANKWNRASSGALNTGRRQFVQGLGASLIAAPGLASTAWARGGDGASDLFPLGVASGDPDEHSVVLWTRLAPDPLNGGGLRRPQRVLWKVALDPEMRHVIKHGYVVARPQNGHTVNAVATDLPSNTWLYYQFYSRGQKSRVGRTRTFPAPWDHVEHMRFGLASCQNYIAGFYPAYRDMVEQDLDFVVHVGDYIYENGATSNPNFPGRNHTGGEIFTVEEYRNRYALYRLDPDLQAAHANYPFLVTWDDHEVDNNVAGRTAEEGAPFTGDAFLERRRNAFQAYAESMPLRPSNRLGGRFGFLRLYRQLQFGEFANIYMLDSRQFRTDQPAEDGFGSPDVIDPVAEATIEGAFGEEIFDAAAINAVDATMLGRAQERWLSRRVRRSKAQWNVFAQGVMVMRWNLVESARATVAFDPNIPPVAKDQILAALATVNDVFNVDAWDGYRRAQQKIHDLLARFRPNNPVFLTGDIHSSWGANLLERYDDPNSDVLAAEFVCSGIASTFGGSDPRPTDAVVRASLGDNPHVEFYNGLFRGYALCDVNASRWRTTYRAVGTLADVQNPAPDALLARQDSPVQTDAVVEVEAGFNRRGRPKRLQTVSARIPV